jgi:hypothetical protein
VAEFGGLEVLKVGVHRSRSLKGTYCMYIYIHTLVTLRAQTPLRVGMNSRCHPFSFTHWTMSWSSELRESLPELL